MTENPNPLSSSKQRTWREIVEELHIEEDQERILQLATELNDLMVEEERQKVKERIERNPPAKPPGLQTRD